MRTRRNRNESAPVSSVTPEDIRQAAENAQPKKEEEKVSITHTDHGPLRTYKVTWADGKTETLQGHSVMLDSSWLDQDRTKMFRIYGDFQDEAGWHWRMVLAGRLSDLKAVRDVTPPAEPKHASLPEKMRKPTGGYLQVGDAGYTQPHAMIADRDGKLWLQNWAQLERCSGGDATMRVEMRADGIHVWEVPGRRYTRQQYAPGSAWPGLVPVAVLETGDSA